MILSLSQSLILSSLGPLVTWDLAQQGAREAQERLRGIDHRPHAPITTFQLVAADWGG